jgi:hypothetical protein
VIVWTLSDGTTVSGAAVVIGTSDVASVLLAGIDSTKAGHPWRVEVASQPGGNVDLDLANPWILGKWVESVARQFGQTLTRDGDVGAPPAEVLELLAIPREAEDGFLY